MYLAQIRFHLVFLSWWRFFVWPLLFGCCCCCFSCERAYWFNSFEWHWVCVDGNVLGARSDCLTRITIFSHSKIYISIHIRLFVEKLLRHTHNLSFWLSTFSSLFTAVSCRTTTQHTLTRHVKNKKKRDSFERWKGRSKQNEKSVLNHFFPTAIRGDPSPSLSLFLFFGDGRCGDEGRERKMLLSLWFSHFLLLFARTMSLIAHIG